VITDNGRTDGWRDKLINNAVSLLLLAERLSIIIDDDGGGDIFVTATALQKPITLYIVYIFKSLEVQ